MRVVIAVVFISITVSMLILMTSNWRPDVLGQPIEEWNIYLNPEFRFTIQYPEAIFGKGYETQGSPGGYASSNSTEFSLTSSDADLYLSIIPLNSTTSKTDSALSMIRDQYNEMTQYDTISSIQNITEVKYGGQQAYKTILDAGGGSIYIYASLQHDNVTLFFYMYNDRTNFKGALFDQIVNSTKFF